ncbi:MAG: type II secretion system F family protein [Candidatus Micrarchaeia archaeon]
MVEGYADLVKNVGYTLYDYLTQVVLPIFVLSLLTSVVVYFLVPQLFTGIFLVFLFAFPFLVVALVLVYPYLLAENVKTEIENNIHFFVTQMGALSTCEVPTGELFRVMAARKEYGALADSCRNIYLRFSVWRTTLADACRIEARQTPSIIFADFLDRFANALEAGENIEVFLGEEQEIVLSDYSIRYRGALYDVDVLKEVYTSMVITLVFLVSFAIVIPYISGTDPTVLIGFVMILYAVAELGVVYYIKSILPEDRIWYTEYANNEMRRQILPAFAVSLVGIVFVSLIINTYWRGLPAPIMAALTITPLVGVGYVARSIEELIKRRDMFFVEFIISLGLETAARGGVMRGALKSLAYHDFGPLTPIIKNLFERIKTNIDVFQAWHFFRIEAGSYLISRFSEMFIEAIGLGGKPNAVAQMIGRNFMKLQMLRRERYHATTSFIGIMYGLQAGVIFCIYVSNGILVYLNKLYTSMEIPESVFTSLIMLPKSHTLEVISLLLLIILLANALLSAVAIRLIDGGHLTNSLLHFVGLTWTGAITAVIVDLMLAAVLPAPTIV